MNIRISRRVALKQLALGVGAVIASACSLSPKRQVPFLDQADQEWLSHHSPIDRIWGKAPAAKSYFGDKPEATAHRILWDKESFLAQIGELPKPKKKVPVIIIGGGMSGLSTAYHLRRFKPVVIEQSDRFGGNAKGMKWNDVSYSIGAAYFENPSEGDPLHKLLTELNLWSEVKQAHDSMAIYQGQKWKDFWSGKNTPAEKNIQKSIHHYIEKMRFPEIPTHEKDMRQYVNKLDRSSLQAHLEKHIGGPIPRLTATFLEHYCWSSFGGSMNEISAAAGLNFLATEFEPLGVLPGGNSRVAEALLEKLWKELPNGHLLPQRLVFDVREENGQIQVAYVNPDGSVETLACERCVFSCPKFVAAKLWNKMDMERQNAIGRLRYRSYLVGNVLTKAKAMHDHYETFYLSNGMPDNQDIETYANDMRATDVILANFSSPSTKETVFTLYRAMPFDGARPMLLEPESYQRFRQDFEKDVETKVKGLLTAKDAQIEDIQITRWGHPLPLAEVGLFSEKVVDILHRPHQDKYFFVEQDNWMQPAIETAVGEASYWSPKIAKML
jgi:protoporphyrinogen oxidase